MPDPHHDAPLMLGVSGLRGIVGKSLTPEVAVRYAGAFGAWLIEREGEPVTVLLGRDGRAGGEAIHAAAMAGLLASGCVIVIDLGVVSTPTVGYMADHLAAEGALIVTASHNPQEWNGLKCIVTNAVDLETFKAAASEHDQMLAINQTEPIGARAPTAREAAEIIARFHRGTSHTTDQVRCGQPTSNAEAPKAHLDAVLGALDDAFPGLDFYGMFDRDRPTRVVVDSVNCSGHELARRLFAHPSYEFVPLAGDNLGVFPHPPEPTRENLTRLCEAVRGLSADIGFAQDPDADRLAIIDERGHYIGEEYTLALAALALLWTSDTPVAPHRVLCTNLSTSRMIDDIAARHGARVIRTPVGEANVVEAMKREKAAGRDVILGGEGNGGVIWPQVTYVRDSLSAMALVLALMARTGKTVSQLVADIPAYAIEKRKVALARKEDARPAIDKLAAAHASERLDLQDGVRIDFDATKSWLHVRASNTEPIMRLIAEAPTPAQATALLDEAARIIAS